MRATFVVWLGGSVMWVSACFPQLPDEVPDAGDTAEAPVDTAGADTGVTDTLGGPNCGHLDGACVLGVWDAAALACEARVQLGQSCDDGDACTVSDACDAAGACVGAPRDCDDGVACSIDSCESATGCVYDTAACPCSTGADCADGKPCTDDVCDPATWTCRNPIGVGNACSDLDPCTVEDACDAAGRCVGVAKVCDDGNACTAARCDGLTGQCVFTPVADGVMCDDGDGCTASDRCVSGVCEAGYLASFDRQYPPYDGLFTRVFQQVVHLPDGSFLIADRTYYDGPANIGIRALRLSGAGTPLALGDLDYPILGPPHPEVWTTAALGLELLGSSAYMLANNSGIARIHVETGEATGWLASSYSTDLSLGAFAIDSGSGLALWGHTRGASSGAERLWFGRIDLGLNLVSHTVSTEVQARGVLLHAITDGFLAAGLVSTNGGDDVWVGRLDANGQVQWGHTFSREGAQYPVAILPNLDHIVIVGRVNSPIDGQPRPWFLRVSWTGEELADVVSSDGVFHVAGATRTPSGGYLLVGHRPIPGDGDQFERAHAMWLDANGASTGAQDGPNDHYGYASVRAIATGYILTGHTGNPFYNSSGRLLVTDFDLQTPCQP